MAGIHGDLYRWFKSYVENRTQSVVLNGYTSEPVMIPSGVPQGSILGPLLFTLFILDINSCFLHSKSLLFADDMKFFIKVTSLTDAQNLQDDINRLSEYCDRNKLDLNIEKCHSITFTRKKNPLVFDYAINHQVLRRTSEVNDLGVILDNKLLFDKHIAKITAKATKSLGFLFRVSKNFRSAKTVKIIFCSLVRSHLEYCSQVWNPSYSVYIDKLEMVQRKFLRYLNRRFRTKIDNYLDRCRHFHFLPLHLRRETADLALLSKLFSGDIDVPELLSLIGLRVPAARSSRRSYLTLQVPSTALNYRKNSYILRVSDCFNKKISQNVDISKIKASKIKLLQSNDFFSTT